MALTPNEAKVPVPMAFISSKGSERDWFLGSLTYVTIIFVKSGKGEISTT
ncbi:hypothetical protein [Rossellomorea sp. DUT-2]